MTTTNAAENPRPLKPKDFVKSLLNSRWRWTTFTALAAGSGQVILSEQPTLHFGFVEEFTLKITSITELDLTLEAFRPAAAIPETDYGQLHKWSFEAVYTEPALSVNVISKYIDSNQYFSYKGEIMWAWGEDQTHPVTGPVVHHRGRPVISMVSEGEYPGATGGTGHDYWYSTYCGRMSDDDTIEGFSVVSGFENNPGYFGGFAMTRLKTGQRDHRAGR
jgi:hypothetical protein